MNDFVTAPLSKEFIEIDGKKMAFHQTGEGRPVVFLHGNPTSSYLWRNIIPLVSGNARCIAPDFIGMGDSEKLKEIDEDSYRFFQHRHYLDGFLDALELGNKLISFQKLTPPTNNRKMNAVSPKTMPTGKRLPNI